MPLHSKNFAPSFSMFLSNTNEFVVSSLRADAVIARIISSNRETVKNKIKNKDILVNYKVLANNSYVFRDGDIFSIRKFGKYKFSGVVKMTKKDNYVICCFKYL